MLSKISATVIMLLSIFNLQAVVPSTMSGEWKSDPLKISSTSGNITAVYAINLGVTEAKSGKCVISTDAQLQGVQIGSRMMKVNLPVKINAAGDWTLASDTLNVTIVPESIKVDIDPESVELDVPPVMREAMASRMNEFIPAITGAVTNLLTDKYSQDGITITELDFSENAPATIKGIIEGSTVSMKRQ